MGPTRRHVLAGALAAAASRGLHPGLRTAKAQEAEQVSIALDWYPNANHAGLFLADARGDFAAAGLDVELVIPADPTAVLQTVAGGRDTFGISYQPDILLARAEGLPIVALSALVPRPLLGIMSLAGSGITRPADLAGKTVGYTGIPSQEAFLRTMLEADGLTMDDITLNNVEFNLLPTVISNGAVAVMGAFWTHETIVAEQQGYPVDLMHVEDWGVPIYNELVLVTSEETHATRSDAITNVLGVIRDGYLAAAADTAAALDALVTAYPETELAVETEGVALLAELWAEPSPGFGAIDRGAWQAFAEWMVGSGLLPADFALGGTISELASQPIPAGTPVAG